MTHIDSQLLGRLIDDHGPALTLYARQWCRAPDDAVQESLIDLVRQELVPDNPIAWLYVAVRRRAMNLARADKRRASHQVRAHEQREQWFLPQDDLQDDPIDLEPALAELPRLEREIVVARIWGELSFQQIAELVEQSTSSVHRRYHQALLRLEQLLDEQIDDSRHGNESRQTSS